MEPRVQCWMGEAGSRGTGVFVGETATTRFGEGDSMFEVLGLVSVTCVFCFANAGLLGYLAIGWFEGSLEWKDLIA